MGYIPIPPPGASAETWERFNSRSKRSFWVNVVTISIAVPLMGYSAIMWALYW